MARDPVKISATLDDNSLSNELFVGISDGTEQMLVNADGSINTTINNASITVTATDLDIRDLTHVSDSVSLGDGTEIASVTASNELQVLASAQPGVDIGDVTINNAAGASAVNIQDGGNVISIDDAGGSITIDGTVTATNPSVQVDDAAFTVATSSVTMMGGLADETAPDSVDEGDGGAFRMTLDRKLLTRVVGATDANRLDVSAAGNAQVEVAIALPAGTNNIGDVDVLSVPAPLSTTGGGVEATALRVTIASDSTGLLSVDDNGGSLTIDAVDLDIRDLSHTTDSVEIGDGTDTMAVNADGSINVVVAGSSGTAIADYDQVAALASAASDNHDYTAAGGAFSPTSVTVSGESIGTFDILANAVAIATLRTSVENPNAVYEFPSGFSIATTQVLRVTRTNDSNKAHSFESTINGSQA